MKLITFAIPSFNSEAYLHRAVESLLPGGEDIEIIIINDGSTDGTAAVADRYAEEYANIVKVIHKANGGHGSGVNKGLENAEGVFFKVVDSDDWVDADALKTLISTLKDHTARGIEADMYVMNFVYDHVQDNTAHTRDWRKHFPADRICSWSETKPFILSQVLLMHNIVYRTEPLRASGTVLPEHTFYVDNLFVYKPLPYMKKLYYLDIDLYHYFIGREDQSVNIKNFTKRYDQQLRVMRCMTDSYTYGEIMSFEPGLRKYMLHDLSVIMMNTMMFCASGGSDEVRKEEYRAMWNHILDTDPQMHDYLYRKSFTAFFTLMPWKMRGKIMLWGYKLLCKFLKLG